MLSAQTLAELPPKAETPKEAAMAYTKSHLSVLDEKADAFMGAEDFIELPAWRLWPVVLGVGAACLAAGALVGLAVHRYVSVLQVMAFTSAVVTAIAALSWREHRRP